MKTLSLRPRPPTSTVRTTPRPANQRPPTVLQFRKSYHYVSVVMPTEAPTRRPGHVEKWWRSSCRHTDPLSVSAGFASVLPPPRSRGGRDRRGGRLVLIDWIVSGRQAQCPGR